MKKIECKLNKKELEYLYIKKGMSQLKLCNVLGVKSPITVSKILHSYGISTNKNQIRSNITKKGMSDDEFKNYLKKLYYDELLSINKIAKKLNVSTNVIRKYFKKYNMKFRNTNESRKIAVIGNKNPNWKGGKLLKRNGYIQIYMPEHPQCNSRGYIYEHRLIMEKNIGRYLEKYEVVHHIDFNKCNNNISNLMIVTPQEHIRLHTPHKKKEDKNENS